MALCGLALGAGCGGARPDPHSERPPIIDEGRFIAVERDEPLAFDAMVQELANARAVYVGEQHDRKSHHTLQLAIIEALHRQQPSLAIGMEMFERRFQAALDDWVAGRIDAQSLRRRTEWDERWGFGFDHYEPILEFARRRGIRVVALNAPRELVHRVAQRGPEALDEEQRAQLPPLELEDGPYRDMIERALSDHPHMDAGALERFVAAQLVWDETMAQAVSDVLDEPDGPAQMVVIAGAMHVRGGLGIPRRAARRGARPYRVVLPLEGGEEPLHAPDEIPVADYVWLPPASKGSR